MLSKLKLKANNGFTVVEVMVAFTLFVTLLAISSGVFIRALRTQRMITALIAANSNASLTLEQIVREARTGEDFCIAANSGCKIESGVLKELIFTNARNEKVKYELSAPRAANLNTIQSIMRSVNDETPIPMTADNVNVKNFSFYLGGQDAGDGRQPKITIAIGLGATGISFSDALINLQTTVSSRTLQD